MNALTRFLALATTLTITQLHAADPKTLMTERGKLLLSEDFSKPIAAAKAEKGKPATTGWRMAKGKWETGDGALKGIELKEDKHGAVARYPLEFKDAVIQYDVRVDGCKATTLSINDAKGHVCRVLINKDGFSSQKDDHDKDGPDKVLKFGTQKMDIKAGEWKTVIVEIKGEEMLVHIDGKAVTGKHELIAVSKANFGFTVSGESASFRNLRVWEAQPNEGWSKTKEKLTAAK
ncbi:MAG: hypothetical protein K0Q55_2447 [Verrucomicrobia bacterium]|jgi:hypothetical protein|nr:hypothetical protein [Verrucomicrobiota bacterium]